MNALTYISRFLQIMKLSDFIDVTIIILFVHYLMKMVKETRARQLIKGIVIILLTLPISAFLNLTAVSYILKNTMQLGAFALIVLFQPELRNMLEKVGRSNVGKILDFSALQNDGGKDEGVIDDIAEAVMNMSRKKTGREMLISLPVPFLCCLLLLCCLFLFEYKKRHRTKCAGTNNRR